MITIDNDKCSGCGLCVADCVFNSLKPAGRKVVQDGRCILCGHCVAICPEKAVSIPEYDMGDVEEIHKDGFSLDAATLLKTIKSRRSIRSFTGRKVERDKLNKIIQAGRYTATGSNAQGCTFVVVQDELHIFKEMIRQGVGAYLANGKDLPPGAMEALRSFAGLREKNGIDFLFRDAPAVLCVAAESAVDAGLAAQNMELTAVAQGLGILFNGYVARLASANKKARAWLGVGTKPVAVSMLIGYPDVRYQRTAPRKPADTVWR